MHKTTSGIVIKERPIGEKDKVITVLTRNLGVVEAIARGVRNTKSKLLSGVSLFTYSDFEFYEGKNYTYINSAEEKNSFHSISDDIEKMSLCFYFSELVITMNPGEEESNDFLRLFLNSLYLLSNNERDKALVKAVFELKTAEYCGMMPDITACENCGVYEGAEFYLDAKRGHLLCSECKTIGCYKLTSKSLMALRFVFLNKIDKAFNFTLDEASLELLSIASEGYILNQTQYRFKTLDFYSSLIKG